MVTSESLCASPPQSETCGGTRHPRSLQPGSRDTGLACPAQRGSPPGRSLLSSLPFIVGVPCPRAVPSSPAPGMLPAQHCQLPQCLPASWVSRPEGQERALSAPCWPGTWKRPRRFRPLGILRGAQGHRGCVGFGPCQMTVPGGGTHTTLLSKGGPGPHGTSAVSSCVCSGTLGAGGASCGRGSLDAPQGSSHLLALPASDLFKDRGDEQVCSCCPEFQPELKAEGIEDGTCEGAGTSGQEAPPSLRDLLRCHRLHVGVRGHLLSFLSLK